MKLRFVHKRFMKKDGLVVAPARHEETPVLSASKKGKKSGSSKSENKKEQKKEDNMNEMEKFAAAEETIAAMAPEVKVVKKERGLIERTESSKIILTEDNRQVLND